MQPEKKGRMALVCLQARHVAGLPAAAEGRRILLHLLHHQQQQEEMEITARCRAGVAAFHDQVLLLHCAPIVTPMAVTVTVSFNLHHHDALFTASASGLLNLAVQPSPSALSFILGGGAILSLTLHHRLIQVPHRCRSACLPLLNCLWTSPSSRDSTAVTADHKNNDDDRSSSSSGFITIEKGTISRRRPPSDNLLTTDDDEGDGAGKPTRCYPPWPMALAEELEVEKEFLDKLEADDLDLDALIKDAEAELDQLLYL